MSTSKPATRDAPTVPTLRILHTSDWHLGRRLGSRSRLDDQMARIAEIVAYVERERIDLVLVAGDVFDELRVDALSPLIGRLATALRPPLEEGVRIVFVAGNHDRGQLFALLDGVRTLVAPQQSGLVTFVDEPSVVSLRLRGGQDVDVIALPYPTADRYGLDPTGWPSLETKYRALAEAVRGRVRALASHARPGVPSVLCGHLLLSGVSGGRCAGPHEEIPIDPRLPSFAYVALGHIHRPTSVDAAGAVRYSGSLERMDQGEASDEKSVVLIEVPGAGPVVARTLPLHPRALAVVSGGTREELLQRRAELHDPDGTLVFARVQLRRDRSLRELLADLHALFPLLYGYEVEHLDEPIEPMPDASFVHADPAVTVGGYLEQVLAGDPDRDDLLALASELLAEHAAERRSS